MSKSKMTKKSFAIILVLILLLTTLSALITVSAVQVNITANRYQGRSMWCWAACAIMSGTQNRQVNIGNSWPTLPQSTVVNYIKGYVDDLGAEIWEIVNAANYAYGYYNGIYNSSQTWFEWVPANSMYFQNYYNQINNNHSFIIEMMKQGGGKHVLTLYSAQSSGQYVQYIDPWDASSRTIAYSTFRYSHPDLRDPSYTWAPYRIIY